MPNESGYALSGADEDLEKTRLHHLEAAYDPFSIANLSTIDVSDGWRCLEVGAGGGSITRWLAERAGPSGHVVATDINVQYLTDLPSNVSILQHNVLTDPLEEAAFDLVHCRALVTHLPDPAATLQRLVAAVAPRGWLLVEDPDMGLFTMFGVPEAGRATALLHEFGRRAAQAGIIDIYAGRRLPALFHELPLTNRSANASTAIAGFGESAYEANRLAVPSMRPAYLAVGLDASDHDFHMTSFNSSSARAVLYTLIGAWGQKPGA